MADSDLPGLTALAGASLAAGDLFHVVDVSDTTAAADGTDKKMAASAVVTGLSALGLGVPAGGVEGEVLVKQSSTDGDANWDLTFHGTSVISGNINVEGGRAQITDASSPDAYHFEAGRWNTRGGDVYVSDLPGGGAYFYLYGGTSQLRGGDVTISGNHEKVMAQGGNMDIIGGSAEIHVGGPDAYNLRGGRAMLQGGATATLDGTSGALGGKVQASGSEDGVGGGVTVWAPANGSVPTIECAADNKLGFYGQTPVAKQTGVAVNLAAVHAALVNLGLISA